MDLHDMQTDENSTFKNSQDKWEIPNLSKHLSHIKWSHLLASPVTVIFCGLCLLFTKQGQNITQQPFSPTTTI